MIASKETLVIFNTNKEGFIMIYECLENGAINELINFSFDEVKRVFNRCAYYVPEACEDQFVKEATAVKTW